MLQRRRIIGLASVGVLVAGIVVQAIASNGVYASQITSRSLTLQGVGTTGGSAPGGTVDHSFAFTLPTTGTLGSIRFLYCTLPGSISDPCTGPTGLDTSGATLGTSTGATFTSAVSTAANDIYITRSAASGGGAVVEQLLNVVNPTNANGETFFVRIASYTTTTPSGGGVDTGTVAAATARPIVLTGTMPESLVFCTGGTVGLTSGVPDCATATSGAVGFDRLFSPTDTAIATSQMAASTNAGSGYIITVNGPTLTSGSNTISGMSTLAGGDLGVRGTSQFGLNLKLNTTTTSTPAVGLEVAPASNGTNYRGEATTGYASVDHFRFVTGNTVADSGFSSLGGTDAQIYTVSYIVNVPGSQPAGTYTTTLTYICTPTF